MLIIIPLILISLIVSIVISFLFDTSITYQILIIFGLFFSIVLAFVILFFIILTLTTFFENKKKVRFYQSKYFRRHLYIDSKFLFKLFNMKIHYTNPYQIDKSKQYMIISNHRSNLDSLIIDTYFKDLNLTFVAKDSLFKIPYVGKIIHGCAYIELDRKNLRQEILAIKKCEDFISRNDKPLSIGVFPEGTRGRNKDNLPNEFKSGTFHIAMKTQKPVIISCLRDTDKVNDKLLFKKHDVYYDVIKILHYDDYKDMNSKELAQFCRDEIINYLKEVTK